MSYGARALFTPSSVLGGVGGKERLGHHEGMVVQVVVVVIAVLVVLEEEMSQEGDLRLLGKELAPDGTSGC